MERRALNVYLEKQSFRPWTISPNDEPILSATRDGLVWSHETLKALKAILEKKLGELVDSERRRRADEQRDARSETARSVANA